MPNLIDVTNALGAPLIYDRGEAGYGVPDYHDPSRRFKGTLELKDAMFRVLLDLEKIGWLEHIESILTAGTYVNKSGAHGKGIAWDFDGVIVGDNPFESQDFKQSLVYKFGVGIYHPNYYVDVKSLPRRTATRVSCLFARRFGVVLTATYKSEDGKYHHKDHIHADLSRPVKWYGSQSQHCLIRETVEAWDLQIPNIHDDESFIAWLDAMTFNPPEVPR